MCLERWVVVYLVEEGREELFPRGGGTEERYEGMKLHNLKSMHIS